MAEPTIIIDAGHGGYDNGATYQGRREKDDNLRLALAVGERLQELGFPVVYTRTTDVYQRPNEKARIGNESGGDYFVSIHRNSSVADNIYSGIQTLVYQDSGMPARLARSINEQLVEVGFNDLGVSVRPDLAVLRRTDMPAVLVEAGFLNNDMDNQMFDEEFDDVAEAIAVGIRNAVGMEGPTRRFGVQVGLYRRYENARYLQNQLREQGYESNITDWEDFFAVVVGSVDSLEAARTLEQQLQNLGYQTLIVNVN